MPRMDDSTGENLVTDVRLKRTIRDYWLSKDLDVLIKAVTDDKGNRKTMGDLVDEYLGSIGESKSKELRNVIISNLPKDFIDVRTFGATVTLKKANVSITGTVQFGLGRSLNLPNIETKTITTTLASKGEKGQGTIGEYHTVDYSLIKFHGIISELTASESGFSDGDVDELLEGLWMGTKLLNTRSKFNHLPRLLINIKYKEGNSQIGDLDLYFKLSKKEDIKSLKDVELDISEFVDKIKVMGEIIEDIGVKIDEELKLFYDGENITSDEFIQKISAQIIE